MLSSVCVVGVCVQVERVDRKHRCPLTITTAASHVLPNPTTHTDVFGDHLSPRTGAFRDDDDSCAVVCPMCVC